MVVRHTYSCSLTMWSLLPKLGQLPSYFLLWYRIHQYLYTLKDNKPRARLTFYLFTYEIKYKLSITAGLISFPDKQVETKCSLTFVYTWLSVHFSMRPSLHATLMHLWRSQTLIGTAGGGTVGRADDRMSDKVKTTACIVRQSKRLQHVLSDKVKDYSMYVRQSKRLQHGSQTK